MPDSPSENAASDSSHAPHEHGYLRFIEWLNEVLYRPLGPPPVGPYDEVVGQVGASTCPVCGQPMSLHSIDRSTENAVLHCPAPPEPLPAEEPVSELGMNKPKN